MLIFDKKGFQNQIAKFAFMISSKYKRWHEEKVDVTS